MLTQKKFARYCDEFITYLTVEKNLAQNTTKSYRSDLDQLLAFWTRVNEKQDIPFKAMLDRFLVFMYNEKISKASIARKISCFKSLTRYLADNGIELPFHITRPKTGKKLPVYLTIDEMLHLLDTVEKADLDTKYPLRDKAILELLYATGMRCSELVAIELDAIDFENKTIRVIGKGNKERIVLFGEKAKQKLLTYLSHERLPSKGKKEYLFLNIRQERMTTRSIQRIIEGFRKYLKIDRPITPHKLRHSFATHMLSQGVDLRVVQELLGHQSLSSTEIYTHVTTTELADLCNSIHPIKDMIRRAQEI